MADDLIPAPLPSSATVELAPGVLVPTEFLRLVFARGGGPGGQNVNKLNTKAELWVTLSAIHGLTERARLRLEALAGRRLTQAGTIHLSCHEERSQEANKQAVFDRLREMIIEARHEPKARRKTKPSRGSKLRRLESKKRRSETKSGRRFSSE